MKITLEVAPDIVELLKVLGDPVLVIGQLIDHAQQGVQRPGSWERPWLQQCFGNEFEDRLEPDPSCEWHDMPLRPM